MSCTRSDPHPPGEQGAIAPVALEGTTLGELAASNGLHFGTAVRAETIRQDPILTRAIARREFPKGGALQLAPVPLRTTGNQ